MREQGEGEREKETQTKKVWEKEMNQKWKF